VELAGFEGLGCSGRGAEGVELEEGELIEGGEVWALRYGRLRQWCASPMARLCRSLLYVYMYRFTGRLLFAI